MEDLIHPILSMFIYNKLPLGENYHKWFFFVAIIFIQFSIYPINEFFKGKIISNKMIGANHSVIGVSHNAPFDERRESWWG
jgi:hypothetical protein